jgi:molecular chaperone GrpE
MTCFFGIMDSVDDIDGAGGECPGEVMPGKAGSGSDKIGDADPHSEASGFLEQELANLRGELEKSNAQYQNYKNTLDKRYEERMRFANQQIVEEFLDIRDNLERALDAGGGDVPVVEGVKLTLKMLDGLLKRHGIRELNPVGESFDPNYHEALCVEQGDVPGEVVGEVLQKGYALHSRVIRPAKVKIIKPMEVMEDGKDTRD